MLLSIASIVICQIEHNSILLNSIEWVDYRNLKLGYTSQEFVQIDPDSAYNSNLRILNLLISLCCILLYFKEIQLEKHIEMECKYISINLYTLDYIMQSYSTIFTFVSYVVNPVPSFNLNFEYDINSFSYMDSLNNYMLIIIYMRQLSILKFILWASFYSDYNTYSECKKYDVRLNDMTKCKFLMKQYPSILWIIFFVVLTSTFGQLLCNFEYPYMHVSQMYWDDSINGVWCIIITMTTIGYGDFRPSTYPGMLLVMVAMFVGLGMSALMIIFLGSAVKLNYVEEEIYNHEKVDSLRDQLYDEAANLIKYFIMLHYGKFKSKKHLYVCKHKVFVCARRFKLTKIFLEKEYINVHQNDTLDKLKNKFEFDMEVIDMQLSEYNENFERIKRIYIKLIKLREGYDFCINKIKDLELSI